METSFQSSWPPLPLASLQYDLTEEIVRQAVEVAFAAAPDWSIAFTNPTAGPWKRIKIGGYVGGRDLRYEKEEDRPDLLLFNRQARLYLVLEAKDDLNALLVSRSVLSKKTYPQLGKSVTVFAKELKRLDTINQNPESARLVWTSEAGLPPTLPINYTGACGYVYPAIGDNWQSKAEQLETVHAGLSGEQDDARVRPCLHFVVTQGKDQVLRLCAMLEGGDQAMQTLLAEHLPSAFERGRGLI